MTASIEDHNQSINYDEIEEFVSNEEKTNHESQMPRKLVDDQLRSSSCVSQVQQLSLSREKSAATTAEKSSDQSHTKENKSVLSVKTSNIPGPVGLLPRLVRSNSSKILRDFHGLEKHG